MATTSRLRAIFLALVLTATAGAAGFLYLRFQQDLPFRLTPAMPHDLHFVDAALLGVVEGFTEFLPISSTGHLILTSRLFGIIQSDFAKTFEIAIRVGAMLAVVLLYWRKLISDRDTQLKVAVAFLPTAVVGFRCTRS